MQRAAILIGVRQAGELPTLQAVTKSLQAMKQWAVSQNFTTVEVLSDDNGPVDPMTIYRTVEKIADAGTCEQLLLFFSGHGVNIRYGEYWLLSDAPRNSQAAVNVDGTVQLARYAGIPHVALISDCCRTAAEGLQAQSVVGSLVFPNDPVGEREAPVDVFFATGLGRPALEVRDPAATSRSYCAVYTDALIDALNGNCADCMEPGQHAGTEVAFVRPRPLKKYLIAELPRRLRTMHVDPSLFQTPDARITSDPTAWLARLNLRAPPSSVPSPPGGPPVPSAPAAEPPPATAADISRLAIKQIVDSGDPHARPSTASDATVTFLSNFVAGASQPFEPMKFESQCGFKLRGSQIVDAYSRSKRLEQLGAGVLRVWNDDGLEPASIVLQFANATSAVLPAIPEYICSITFDDDELIEVAYEPSANSPRWADYEHRAKEVRALRALISASARLGAFQLEEDDAVNFARRMMRMKKLDPTLAVHAAYAYHHAGQQGQIQEMFSHMQERLGFIPFDVALLAGALDRRSTTSSSRVYPFVPLLGQGWGLMPACRVRLPPAIEQLQADLKSSLWTLFDGPAAQRLRDIVNSGEVR